MNVLMIGAGMVAQTHILAMRDNQAGARLVGVLGRDPARVQRFCSQAADTLGYDVLPHANLAAAIAQAQLVLVPVPV